MFKYLRSITEQEQLGEIVENNTNRFVAEGVSEPVLVRIVDPFWDPDHGSNFRVLRLVLHDRGDPVGRAWSNDSRQLFVQLGKVAIFWTSFSSSAGGRFSHERSGTDRSSILV